MIGKGKLAVSSGQLAASGKNRSSLPTARCLLPTSSRGFTLLELMIVISIIVILAVIAMPQYQRTIVHTRETVLRDDLFQLRKVIDMYAADKGKLPQSADDLVNAGYLREVPVDPITGEKDWQWVTGEDPGSNEGGQGITDVHSASPDRSSEDTPYSEW
ncbi:MAG: ral secretion pathway protein [Acidobacteriota bacterium]|nr:ral secretion pathway protein [Acidobacteriota bacterium]